MAGARHKFNELEVEMIDINELRRLAQAATPGPWINHGRHMWDRAKEANARLCEGLGPNVYKVDFKSKKKYG
jgi:hypothetical protein